tara:strand:+ start:416 stop:619 length:204 start_codon:yes stop_codon:yes gene_type:complete
MTDKVNQWIWYVDLCYNSIKRLKLKSFLKKVNEDPYHHRAPRKYFATKTLCQDYLRGTRQQAKLAKT